METCDICGEQRERTRQVNVPTGPDDFELFNVCFLCQVAAEREDTKTVAEYEAVSEPTETTDE